MAAALRARQTSTDLEEGPDLDSCIRVKREGWPFAWLVVTSHVASHG